MAHQDTLRSVSDRFSLAPSTVMQIVNAYLYILTGLKSQYIFWPKTAEEYEYIRSKFKKYPGVIGAVDGSHVNIKVPTNQHDSYIDRYMQHSINLMGICTAEKIFSYVFIGFPGSAHDSRVFSNSLLVHHIEKYGKQKYFPRENYHLIGDSVFPLRTWLMTPYKGATLNQTQKNHNFCLSSDRICIENVFALVKNRFTRIKYINTYSISKAIEISTVACVLHNFCYRNDDKWLDFDICHGKEIESVCDDDNREEQNLGRKKREGIARTLMNIN